MVTRRREFTPNFRYFNHSYERFLYNAYYYRQKMKDVREFQNYEVQKELEKAGY